MSPHAHSCRREPIAAENCIRPAVAIRRCQLDSVNQFSGVVDVPGGSPPRLMLPKTLTTSPIPMVVNTRPDHPGHVLIRAKAYRPAAIPACRGSHICACRWRNVLVSRNAPRAGQKCPTASSSRNCSSCYARANGIAGERLWESRSVETQKQGFHCAWKSRKKRGIPTFPQSRRRRPIKLKPDISCATKTGHFNLLTTAHSLIVRFFGNFG